jgi:hypothetical protein
MRYGGQGGEKFGIRRLGAWRFTQTHREAQEVRDDREELHRAREQRALEPVDVRPCR